MKKTIRPLGQITLALEPLLEEMVDEHELQAQEIAHLVFSWLETHRPGSLPVYTLDGSKAVMFIGHWEVLANIPKRSIVKKNKV